MTVAHGRRPGPRLLLVALTVAVTLTAAGFSLGLTRTPSPRDGRPTVTRPLPGRTVADTIGVASENVWHRLRLVGTRHDLDRITADRAVDIVGRQEATSPAFVRLYPRYRARGWATAYFPGAQGSRENPISWRTRTFRLLSTASWQMHPGAGRARTDAPFPARYVTSVLLRHRRTGLTVRVLNTHVNQTIETGQAFEENLNARYARQHFAWLADHLDRLSGDVVVGTGDFNWDFRDDDATRLPDGLVERLAGRGVSSYQALGLTGVEPTKGSRWIDYVLLSERSVRTARAQFATQRTLDGFRSDHRPLLARIRLYR